METKRFADLWRGIFYMVASVSLIVLMLMFIFVWQPIWTTGFKDFHTISSAITKLNDTAKPTARAMPLMLDEMKTINNSMLQMNNSMNQMNYSISGQMYRMNYEVDKMGDKFSPFGMMPFNW